MITYRTIVDVFLPFFQYKSTCFPNFGKSPKKAFFYAALPTTCHEENGNDFYSLCSRRKLQKKHTEKEKKKEKYRYGTSLSVHF